MAAQRKKQLGVTLISKRALDLVKQHEAAAMRVEQATYYTVLNEAVSALNTNRQDLYAYIAQLERDAGVEQTHKLRF
jgi:hypothetical protein